MQIYCRYCRQSSAEMWLESQGKHSAARSQKTGPETPQAQGSANADSKTETHKDQIWHCSPENRHSVLAQHHDHRQQHFQNACHGKASWQLVYPSHKGNSREAQAQPRSALLHGHDLLGCHHPQVCDRHTQTSIKVHQPQDKADVAQKSTMMFCSSISSQKARDCSSKLAGGQGSGSCSKTMLQLTRPRKTCNASAPMS